MRARAPRRASTHSSFSLGANRAENRNTPQTGIDVLTNRPTTGYICYRLSGAAEDTFIGDSLAANAQVCAETRAIFPGGQQIHSKNASKIRKVWYNNRREL